MTCFIRESFVALAFVLLCKLHIELRLSHNALHSHTSYDVLDKVSVDDNFEVDWKGKAGSAYTLKICSSLSKVSEKDRLDRQIGREEITHCVKKLKTGGRDGIVGELLKYGGSGMVCLLERLFSVIWC